MIGLGELLRSTKDTHKASLKDLTVLSPQNDPFRLDTPANHTKGRWLRDQMEKCGLYRTPAKIHNRGIHYAIVSLGNALLPDGTPYVNNADCWDFLEDASNAARWLGYIEWVKIFDARNAEPVIRIKETEALEHWISIDASQSLPDASELLPTIKVSGFESRQPYRLAFYGEKTSLASVLDPLAYRYDADLYLPSGEISNSLLATMAQTGHDDGREMIVFIFADCDPSGYQMAVSIGHKLRALKEATFPNLSFQLVTAALTVNQVKTLGLPSTPLKETELRAVGWRERYGVEQTEIDALSTLRPDVLREIVANAVDPYFDKTLSYRTYRAQKEWEAEAQRLLEEQIDSDRLSNIHHRAVTDLESLRSALSSLEIETDGLEIDLPPVVIPEPSLEAEPPPALISSSMPLMDHIQILRARKDYSGGAA